MSGTPGQVPRALAELGKDGWEVCAVVPRTMGIGLKNRMQKGSSWGGGMGGLVAGVHVLLRMAVTQATLDAREDSIRAAVGASYQDGRPPVPGSAGLPTMAAGVAAAAAVGTGMVMGYGISYSMPIESGGDEAMGGYDDGGFDGGDFDGGGFDF